MQYKLDNKGIPQAADTLADAFRDDPLWKKFFEGESRIQEKYRSCLLFITGVATELQGKGHGGRLLQFLGDKNERTKNPIYLETETEKNVMIYEKIGYRVIKETTLPLIDQPMWEMVRRPGS